MTQAITDKDFATETDEGLVLIDFWATWCALAVCKHPS